MAVILKSTRTTRSSNPIPMRWSTVTVQSNGRISLTDATNKSIQTLNLGYRGDDKVTRIYARLWKDAVEFKDDYVAALVFHNESGVRHTVDMSSDDVQFYLDIPQGITQHGGNYHIHFLLREKLAATEANESAIGVEDDPAYREVFVSESFNGAIDSKSGYQYLPEDWEQHLYDYTIGEISTVRAIWNDESEGITQKFTCQIDLSGLATDATVDDIIIQPDNLTYVKTLNSKQLILEVSSIDTSIVLSELLDEITIQYPTTFTADASKALKEPISIEHTGYSIKTTGNPYLGMKFDSYVTPINASGLITADRKFIVFELNGEVCICEAQDGYFWIPLCVTQKPGLWNVGFFGETSTYSYYTGLLQLPVMDNLLVRDDIITDSSYAAIQSSDGSYLYDINEFALYGQTDVSESTIKLTYDGATIDRAIGWVNGMAESSYSSSDVIAAMDGFNTVITDMETIRNNEANIQSDIATLQATDSALAAQITAVEESISDLDVSLIEGRVETNEENIAALQTTTAGHTSSIQSLQSKDTAIEANIDSIESTITTIQDKNTEQDAKYVLLDGRLSTTENQVVDIYEDISQLNTGIWKALNEETSARAEKDQSLEARIDSEVARATAVDSTHDISINELTSETERIAQEVTTNYNSLNGRLTTAERFVNAHTTSINDHETRLDSIENDTTIIRNNASADITNFVAKIVFLSSEAEYQALVDAGTIESGTLYLIQEEEE